MAVGTHILVEHWGGQHLTDARAMEQALQATARVAGATVLSSHFHDFEGGGFTGVLMLSESHITVHTWPETGYAALDVFMCGAADAVAAADMLDAALTPKRSSRQVIARG